MISGMRSDRLRERAGGGDHVIIDVEATGLEQPQRLVKGAVLAHPGVGKDEVEPRRRKTCRSVRRRRPYASAWRSRQPSEQGGPGSRGVTFPPARPSARSIEPECDRPHPGRVPASIRLRDTRVLVPRSPNPRLACSGRGRRRPPRSRMRDGLDTAPRRPERPRSPAPPAEASAVGPWCTMREPARRPWPALSASAASSGVLGADARFDPGRACFAPSFITQEPMGQAAPGRGGSPRRGG